jgi:hypothetical protein
MLWTLVFVTLPYQVINLTVFSSFVHTFNPEITDFD